jgi:hypothetical protein
MILAVVLCGCENWCLTLRIVYRLRGKIFVFCDVTPYSLVIVYRHFRATSILISEETYSSEKFVNIQQKIWSHISLGRFSQLRPL